MIMDYSIQYILIGLAIVFNLLGWAYAFQIYLRPAPHGWTWVSVVAGTLIVSVGVMFATYVILDYYGHLHDLWTLIFLDPIALLIIGGPMAILQVVKKMREDSEIENDNQKS